MSLRHSILVLLDREPGSGYDLVQRFRSGIGNFWSATHQQVYQELKRLHREKLVEFEVETQAERPDRKVYRITRAGQRALKDWLRTPVRPPRLRDSLLVKVFGGHAADPAALAAELGQHLDHYRRKLEEYRALEQSYFSQHETGRRRYRLPYLTLRRGIRYLQGTIDWLEETCALIESGALPDKPVPSSGTRTKAAKR
ncbi:MAG TPA: PadR family transcriptional regulator [Nevskiales bacterium]|nr:PadR family transcriptional regulator [Nevskiales bacterium]